MADIFRFIARDDRAAAERWIIRLIERAESLAAFPHKGRVVPEFDRQDVRELVERNYRIVYRLHGDDIWLLTVFEGHRRLRASDIGELDR